ncbi:MAG: ferrous iron transport protein A [Mariniblastus sp.]|jgi:Fe2+ transport system protein FeoA|nr:ferrous iron transport protein A [Mariniblastus sp.]
MPIAIQANPIEKQAVQLQSLGSGEMAEVSSVKGSNHEVARLAEMGLRTGMTVSVNRGGITSIVQLLNGSRLCVRTCSQLEILVTPIQ